MKDFKTLNQQINILISKGLIISDKKKCKELLLKNNYYNIINKYSDLFFLQKNPDKYKANVEFEEIYSLYVFDSKFRNILLKYILLIEDQLKSVLAYTLSELYTPIGYKDPNNYDWGYNNNKLEHIVRFISKLLKNVKLFKEKKSIKHYIYNHNKIIPLWVLVNILSFGDISKFFSNIKKQDREIITRKISRKKLVRADECRTFIQHLSGVRNICAHNERLYDLSSSKIYTTKPYYKKYSRYGKGDNNIFATLLSLKALLSHKNFKKLKKEILEIMTDLFKKIKSIPHTEILKKMGLVEKWYHL